MISLEMSPLPLQQPLPVDITGKQIPSLPVRPGDERDKKMETERTYIPEYSFVIPVYNEELNLAELAIRLCDVLDRLDGDAEVVLVDDGSRDSSAEIALDLHRRDARFKLIRFARNFGHQIAITAGMDFAAGRAVIIMDADLQDPPEVVLDMAVRWREGYEIVYAERLERLGESWFKRKTAEWFYRLQRRLANVDIPANVGDFRLVDRKALDAIKRMRENNRYVRGMFSWVGFRQTSVRFVRPERFAGKPQYTVWKSLKLAVDALISFSYAPLRLALSLGLLFAAFALFYGLWAVACKLTGHNLPGWTSLAVLVSLLGGIHLMVLGVMGEYIGRIFEEVKNRPLYIVRSTVGITPTLPVAPLRTVVAEMQTTL
jgi:dolichol-phosphate mannosyltransferase